VGHRFAKPNNPVGAPIPGAIVEAQRQAGEVVELGAVGMGTGPCSGEARVEVGMGRGHAVEEARQSAFVLPTLVELLD
jgi:hypothetical protein